MWPVCSQQVYCITIRKATPCTHDTRWISRDFSGRCTNGLTALSGCGQCKSWLLVPFYGVQRYFTIYLVLQTVTHCLVIGSPWCWTQSVGCENGYQWRAETKARWREDSKQTSLIWGFQWCVHKHIQDGGISWGTEENERSGEMKRERWGEGQSDLHLHVINWSLINSRFCKHLWFPFVIACALVFSVSRVLI